MQRQAAIVPQSHTSISIIEIAGASMSSILFRGLAALIFAASWIVGSPAPAQDEGGPDAYYVPGPIKKLPNGGRPEKKTPFPSIVNWSTLTITLHRSPCFGTCAGYNVEVDSDGTVTFKGGAFVAISGTHHGRISPEAVQKLFEDFAKADFFWTFDVYHANITDLPTYTVTLSYDGRSKVVSDYAGRALGMPKEIVDLENEIDVVAGTARWVKGNDETFPSLQAEHWDFRATDDEHLAMIGSAATRGNVDLVRRLLNAGMTAKNKYGCEGLAEAADRTPNPELVNLLLEAGAPLAWDAPKTKPNDDEYWDYRLPCDVLLSAASGGNPQVIASVLDRRPDINRRGLGGQTALMIAARDNYIGKNPLRDYAKVVQLLIDAGADVNLRDDDGESALMRASFDGGIVRALLKAGSKDINTRNNIGETPLMRNYDPDVAQALLEAGADPWMVDNDGRTALEICKKIFGQDCRAAPVLKRWMAAHPKQH